MVEETEGVSWGEEEGEDEEGDWEDEKGVRLGDGDVDGGD